jgi:hypothetical protein
MTDNKPIKFWTDTKKPVNLGTLTPQERLELREILKTMEAREWIERYKRRVKDHGKTNALGWWYQIFSDIEKKRGLKATNELKQKMNELQRIENVKTKT